MVYAIEQKYLSLGKESVRGTAVAPTRYIPVGVDSEIDYKLNLLEDEQLRGVMERFSPQAGTKECSGKITAMDVDSLNLGEMLLSLLGSVASTQQGATIAYKHTFTNLNDVQHPSYTFHIERKLAKKQYPLSVVKSIAFNGAVDGKLMADIDFLAKSEAAEGFSPSPTWVDPTPFMFYQTVITIDSTPNTTDIKDWTLNIDNGSIAQRVLNGSQDIQDVLTFAKLLVSGTMNVYFSSETERAKFLAKTATALNIKLTGALIASTYYNTLEIDIPQIFYTAYPYGNLDGLLGAAVAFNGYYKISGTNTIKVYLTNTATSY